MPYLPKSLHCLLCLAAALATATAFVGCSDGGGGGGGNNGNNGVCQYDCFADYRCENGIVYEKQGGPISCNEASSAEQAAQMCANRDEVELRTCAEGCRSDIENISQYPSYTPELCVEDRLAQPGDDCSEDNDCRPSEVDIGPMLCEGGTCVDPAGPEDAGMDPDAGDTADPEDTGPEDTGAEDTGNEDTSDYDTGADTEDTTTDDVGDTSDPADTVDDADNTDDAGDTTDDTTDDPTD